MSPQSKVTTLFREKQRPPRDYRAKGSRSEVGLSELVGSLGGRNPRDITRDITRNSYSITMVLQ